MQKTLLPATVPFVIPSTYGRYALARALATSAAATATVWAMLKAPGGWTLDPLACVSALYVSGMYVAQGFAHEWPEREGGMLALLAASFGAFAAPTALKNFVQRSTAADAAVASPVVLRNLLRVGDVALLLAGWRYMIRGPVCSLKPASQRGRVAVITGCNTGIGYETAAALANAGGTIIFACRSEGRAKAAMQRLVDEAGGRVSSDQLIFHALDVSSTKSVHSFAEWFNQQGLGLHLLILNAGVMLSSRAVSEDGFEMNMASNHLGHFLLTSLLLPKVLETEKKGEQPRIVMVGSNMCYKDDLFDFSELVKVDSGLRPAFMEKPYAMFRAYGQSKLANWYFVSELAKTLRLRGSSVPVNCVHPGEVGTEVMRDMHPVIVTLFGLLKPLLTAFMKTPEQGASCTLHVATAPTLATAANGSGLYFIRHKPSGVTPLMGDEDVAGEVWRRSVELTGAMY
eukprot:TRINITY_DN35826_c0_g1_i1.p1 TRINITY_DN35826_c0_g1~~TRINITY_DN35826_c0_g1_i1.p1  ORF type:complete len:457 (-),score=91.16 TRINITY_DN35826_c0_g1_i1:53-1423(-)